MIISTVETTADTIVFSGVSHASFVRPSSISIVLRNAPLRSNSYSKSVSSQATSCEGKKVLDVKRKGKNWYMLLDSPPHPLFHFGMSGSSQVKGTRAPTYRVGRGPAEASLWPPKYHKASFSFVNERGENVGEWAFCDARRLGRIKMVDTPGDPIDVPPLSLLGMFISFCET
jgi:formamidopyrimidine-DNA glycosylase